MNSKEFYHTRKIATLYHTRDNTKSIVLYLTTEHKIYHLSHSVYGQDALDIANPSSMQGAC